jgi:glycine cleavage system H protein
MPEPTANPSDRRYTSEHEWIKADQDQYLVGITSFAQDQLGDIVFVELPRVGEHIQAGQAFGVIESVKTASDLYAPVSGEVIEVNATLTHQPQTVNDDPYNAGWLIKIKADDAKELDKLLTADQYASQTGG